MDRNSQHNNYLRAHILRSRWYKVFIAAAAIVVFITTYMLILPAITLDAKCGKEEHKHTEECYKEKATLTCQLEESAGHTHTDACYKTTDRLICGLEESAPVVQDVVNEETGEVETVVVSEGHTHDANCYTQDVELICGKEEAAAHKHSDSCYKKEKVLDCTKEEHTHTEACFHEKSDPNADVENESIWTQTFANVQLTGKWNEDVVAIAKTQVGYRESSKNFIYDKDDEKDGYTRYGAWYGDTYGEWCAMFSSFCLHYAGVGFDADNVAFPLEANCANWINKLQQVGYYHDAASSLYMDQEERDAYKGNDYIVEPGDLIFFNLKNSQYVVSDHVGIVTAVTGSKISTIQGNSNNSVLEKDYNVGDVTIVGFGEIPENPNYVDPNKQDDTKEVTAQATAPTTPKKKTVAKPAANTLSEDPDADDEGIAPLDDEGIAPYADATDMTNYVSGITVSKDNGGKWQQDTKFQEGDRVRVDMSFNIPANTVTASNPSIAYTFPAGLLAEGTSMNGLVYDHGNPVGTYVITTDSTGAATIVLTYNSDFADGSPFTGTAYFTAEIGHGGGQTEVEYAFDGTNTKITVTGKEDPYDIRTNKSATLSSDGKSIDYVVDISTQDGTDGAVIVTDALYQGWNGEDEGPAIYRGTVTVEKYGADGQKIQGADTTFQVSGNKFEKELPELSAGQSYKLKYTVDVHDSYASDDGSLTIQNYANGKLKDHPYTQQGSYTQTEVSKTKISKYGSYNQITGQMDFTITINNPKNLDLGNNEVVDVISTSGISLETTPVITDASGNVVSGGTLTQGDGKLFSYKFPSGATASNYYIKYSTSAPAAEGATVDNKATYKGDGEKDYTASSNPSVHHRTFGLTKSTRSKWVDENGIDKFEWQSYMTLPDGSFPQDGYLYEDTIKDATKGNNTFENTHYGTKSEIESKIHETFKISVIENGQVVEKDWSAATNQYVDVQIKYYTSKDGQEVTDDNTEVKYFTVEVKPKNGMTFSATNMSYSYITSGRRTGFTDGKYYFANDGAVGNDHSTPNHDVDMGDINPKKTRVGNPTNDDKGTKVEWQASIDLPQSKLPENGHLFEDTLEDATDSAGTAYPGTHYGTVSEMRSRIEETFSITIDGEAKNLSAAQSYVNVEMKFYKVEGEQKVETTSDDDQVTYFTVKITPKNGQNVTATNATFKYYTRINQNGINGGYFKYQNTLKVGDKESTSSYSKRVMSSLEKSVYTGNAGEWNYKVEDYGSTNDKYIYSSKDGQEVDYKDGIITYRIVVKTGLSAENDQPITITDVIPEGMEYIDDSAKAAAIVFYNMDQENFSTAQSGSELGKVNNGWIQSSADEYYFNEHLHPSVEENVLTLALDPGYASKESYNRTFEYASAGYIAIYYQLRITDPAWNNLTTTKKTYVNEATWEETGFGTSQETRVVRPIDDVSKFAKTEGHEIITADGSKLFIVDKINYDVVINPAGEDLNPDSHFLELVDTMNPGSGTAVMQLESIKLYAYDANAENHLGSPIDTNRYQYHYDPDTKKLTMTIPDELACVLEYTYEVSAGASSHDYTISNKVSLLGKEYDSDDVEMKVQDSGATSEKSKITLYKVDKDNYGKHLAGVEFQLTYLDEDGNWIVHVHDPEDTNYQGENGTLITDENGQIHFDNDPNSDFHVETLKQNTLYKLVEVKNPNTGYVADGSDYYFVWLDDKVTAENWYEDSTTYNHGTVAKDDIHFFEHEGASIYIENEYKNIAVKKVWVDSDGTDIVNPSGNVSVQLNKTIKEAAGKNVTVQFAGGQTKQLQIDDSSNLQILFSEDYNPGGAQISDLDASYYSVTEEQRADMGYKMICDITIQAAGLSDGQTIVISRWTNAFDAVVYKYQEGVNIVSTPVGDPVVLNKSNQWSYSWSNLESGVSYNVKELSIDGKPLSEYDYEVSYQNNNGILTGEIVIQNKIPKQDIKPVKTDISIEKKWKDSTDHELSGDALTGKQAKFRLMQVVNDNVDAATEYATFTLPENGSWTKEFTGLNKTTYDSQGNETHYKYYFEEISSTGTTEPTYQKESFWNFLPWVNGSENAEKTLIDEGSVTVTNKLLPEKTTVSVEKKWLNADGIDDTSKYDDATASVTVDLYKITDNNQPGEKIESNITLNKANSWKYEKNDLIKEEYKDGVKHTYTYYFVETAVDGYKTTYKSATSGEVENASTIAANGGTFTVINKKQEKTSVTVNKKWFKNENGSISEITNKTGTIEFDLYRVATKTSGDEPDEPTCNHTWNDGEITVPAGETTTGTKTFTCTKCGVTKTEPIDPIGHTHKYDGKVTTQATCVSTGVMTYKCSCDYSYTAEIPKDSNTHTGGTYTADYLAPTATTDGHEANTYCSGCRAMLEAGAVIPATGGSTEQVTVQILSKWDNQPLVNTTVDKGSTVTVNISYWHKDYWNPDSSYILIKDPSTGTTYPVSDRRVDGQNTYYTWILNNASNITLLAEFDICNDVTWNVVESQRSVMAAPRMMAAPRNIPAPVSETPTIPTGAEHLGTKQIHSTNGWIYTEEFDAEPGYTYTYYVVEKDNANYTVTYEGEGTANVTINNTEVINSYELPHTGGRGTKLITMLGILLMAVASSLMILKKHRKEEIW